MQKTVSKVLKTWYFHYSAFWSTDQLGRKRLNPGYAFEKHNDCCPLRQHSHLIALFEVFYNSGKIILPWFFEVFIVQFVITFGITLADSAIKTYNSLVLSLLKYIDKWKQFQTWDNILIKYNLNFFVKCYDSIQEPQNLRPRAACSSRAAVCPPLHYIILKIMSLTAWKKLIIFVTTRLLH